MSKILVTGGDGFIGSHLVKALVDRGDEVVVYDNFSNADTAVGNLANSNVKAVEGDIRDTAQVSKTIQKYEINEIHHLAAELEVFKSIMDPYHDADVNLMGTLSVLKAAKENKVKRLFFASSGAVYGKPQYLPIDENHPLRPYWPYGLSKLAAEQYVTNAGFVSFRYGIVYGPREWYGRVLTLFIKRALGHRPLIVFGSGKQTRDYIYVGDIVKAHLDPPKSGVYNLGSGIGISITELAEKVNHAVGLRGKIDYQDPREGKSAKGQPNRPRLTGELEHFVLDSKKAMDAGWKPSTSFDKGLAAEIAWVKGNSRVWDYRAKV